MNLIYVGVNKVKLYLHIDEMQRLSVMLLKVLLSYCYSEQA